MKKYIYCLAAASVIFAGCNKEVLKSSETGSLMIDLDCNSEMNSGDVTKASSDDEDIINNLSIDIVRPYDNWNKTYAPFSSIRGTVVELGSGDYILKAYSPNQKDAAFDNPQFEGKKDFSIVTGQVSTVNVLCKIVNMKVTLALSENFYNELSDFTVTVSNDKGYLQWQKNTANTDFEPRLVDGKVVYIAKKDGYFSVSKLTASIQGHRASDNSTASTTFVVSDVNPSEHHILNVDANVTGTLGGISISIDHTVRDINSNIVVPGFDEIPVEGDPGSDNPGSEEPEPEQPGGEDPQPSTAPTLLWEANPSFAEMPINNNLNADLVVKAPEKIAVFKVNVDSPNLTSAIEALTQDHSSTMDLINDEGLIEFLADAAPNLSTGNNLLGQTQVNFFITDLVKMINMYSPAPGSKHKFTLNVTDEKGQTMSKTVTFVTE